MPYVCQMIKRVCNVKLCTITGSKPSDELKNLQAARSDRWTLASLQTKISGMNFAILGMYQSFIHDAL
ncbi:hypothetical protein EUGRSUZ_J00536 [Eucalyptus grandis]|uniref:Uncharacterized protein n=2 Tax=Eucalyptus grandis TaxID=71139 RepID=A0ACC3J355_EUCGR|nr:hypothetical protein EUGRSUZ_J00536 [Eucalyptus grandis]